MRRLVLLLAGTLAFGAGDTPVCAIGGPPTSYRASDDQSPTVDAMELARDMNGAIAAACTPNCPKLALLRNATSPGLLLIPSGATWKLVYNPKTFSQIDDQYGDPAVVAMISHAFGHTLDAGMPGAWPKEFSTEQRADAWSGCALAQTHASANDIHGSLEAAKKFPPSGNDSWTARVGAMRTGFLKCAGNPAAFDQAAR